MRNFFPSSSADDHLTRASYPKNDLNAKHIRKLLGSQKAEHDDKEEKEKDMNSTTNSGGGRKENVRHKRSYSHERHIEVMVVADSKMAKYHGENLRYYVLTLMATVSGC